MNCRISGQHPPAAAGVQQFCRQARARGRGRHKRPLRRRMLLLLRRRWRRRRAPQERQRGRLESCRGPHPPSRPDLSFEFVKASGVWNHFQYSCPILLSDLVKSSSGPAGGASDGCGLGRGAAGPASRCTTTAAGESSFRTDKSVCPTMLRQRYRRERSDWRI